MNEGKNEQMKLPLVDRKGQLNFRASQSYRTNSPSLWWWCCSAARRCRCHTNTRPRNNCQRPIWNLVFPLSPVRSLSVLFFSVALSLSIALLSLSRNKQWKSLSAQRIQFTIRNTKTCNELWKCARFRPSGRMRIAIRVCFGERVCCQWRCECTREQAGNRFTKIWVCYAVENYNEGRAINFTSHARSEKRHQSRLHGHIQTNKSEMAIHFNIYIIYIIYCIERHIYTVHTRFAEERGR